MSRLGILQQPEQYPRITKKLELRLYDPKLKGNWLEVWVNWSSEFNERVQEAERELSRARLAVGEAARAVVVKARDVLEKVGGELTPTERAVFEVLVTQVEEEGQERLETAIRVVREVTAEFWGCTYEEIVAIYELDRDLWDWCCQQAVALRNDFKATRKKVVGGTGPRKKER